MTLSKWPSSPYKALSFYTPRDAGLFGGRKENVRKCARLLVKEDTKILFLHGTTGCGKSSFIRAGLIPYLESEVGRFQFAQDYDTPKALFIRATDDPVTRLTEALFLLSENPVLVDVPDAEPTVIDLKKIRGEEQDLKSFVDKNRTSVESLLRVFDVLGSSLPKTLIIVLDQTEEIYSLHETEPGRRELFLDFIAAFSARFFDLKLVVAFRTEYYGQFMDELEKRRLQKDRIASFLLYELTRDQLIEAIKMPMATDLPKKYLYGRGQPREQYNFEFEGDLPERIVGDLLRAEPKGGLLPVLQITCERLHQKARAERGTDPGEGRKPWKIKHTDYDKVGKLNDQIGLYLKEKLIQKIQLDNPELNAFLQEEEAATWRDLLYGLVFVEKDGRALSRSWTAAEFKKRASQLHCRVDSDRMIAFLADEDQRILRKDERSIAPQQKTDNALYGLGHDCLAGELTTWRESRRSVLERRTFVNNVLTVTMRTAGITIVVVFGAIIGGVAAVASATPSEALFGIVLTFLAMIASSVFWWFAVGRSSALITRRLVDSPLLSALLLEVPNPRRVP